MPIVGERVDAHKFIPQVMEAGALATLSERVLENADFPYIVVESSLQAVKDIAEFYLKQLQIPVVGITGSVGKTSTKEVIASVLSQKYRTLKTQGNFNNELGLPLTVFRLRDEDEMAVLEMGISDFGEMTRLAQDCKTGHLCDHKHWYLPSGESGRQRRSSESKNRDFSIFKTGRTHCIERG